MGSDDKNRTILNSWKTTALLAQFVLAQEGLTSLDDWGGKETVREILPEDYKFNFDMVQPALIDTILADKNRKVAQAFLSNLTDFVDYVNGRLDAGRPACYHYFAINIEILMALDLVPLCYELLCGVTAALYNDGCEDGIDRFEAEGFPDHLCSTQKGTAGFLLSGVVPKPDIILKSSVPCDASNMVYQWTAQRFNAPLVTINPPYYRNERGLKFMVAELKRMIATLEEFSGNKLDVDRLREYVGYGNESIDYILKTQELRKKKPCPDTGWHRPADTIFMTQIGTPMGARYYQALYEDVRDRADRGHGVIPQNKKERRLAWGYTWVSYDLPFFHWLEEEHGVVYLEDTLTFMAPDCGLVDTTNLDTMLEGLAWRTMNMPMGRQSMGFSDIWINDFEYIAKAFKADMFALAGHMACKHFWALNKLLSDRIKDKTGIPTIRFEMDMFDKRFTPPSELRRILSEFLSTVG